MADGTTSAYKEGLLSVIVPVYNVAPYLECCVNSILAQTYQSLELILVDDGSTDGSGEICDRFATMDARVYTIHRANGGQASARNDGIDAAKGEWLAFVDGDDFVLPELFATLIGVCEERHTDVAACAFNYVYSDHEIPAGDTGRVSCYTRKEALELLPLETDVRFEVCSKVFRRERIGDARFTAGELHEEISFDRVAFRTIRAHAYVDMPLYRYIQARPGNTGSYFDPRKIRAINTCDAFVSDLRQEGLSLAADRMEAFTLDFVIRLYVNAEACHAPNALRRELLARYRKRFCTAWRNAEVRKPRGILFAASPRLYCTASGFLHYLRKRRTGCI